MKRILFIFCLFISSIGIGQITDDFSDNNFTVNPSWAGDDSLFTVNNAQLQSNCTTANKSFALSTASTYVSNAEWHLYVHLQFSTSGANYTDYYIIADNATLTGPVNGYFVRVGNTDDEVSLYRQDGTVSTKIIDGINGRCGSSDNTIALKIKRDGSGVFTLMDDITGLGTNFVTEGVASDVTYTTSSYIGIVIKQSVASFFNKHFFDDVYAGPEIVDVTPPAISQLTVLDSLHLDILFSEGLAAGGAEDEQNYVANNGLGSPAVATLDANNNALVHLTFSSQFQDGLLNTLTVDNIYDLNNNGILPGSTATFVYYAPVIAFPGEIVITELMAAPNGQIGLPNAEYVEIYNRGTRNIDLATYTLSDLSGSSGAMPSYILSSGKYVVICSTTNVPLFTSVSNIIGVTNFPSLNNTGDKISLYNSLNLLINEVNYSDQWYKDPVKALGGYSLERIDADFTCNASDNWKASDDATGGSPGKVNSVAGTFTDDVLPKIMLAHIIGNNVVEIKFNEPMNTGTINKTGNYVVDQGIGTPASVQSISADATTVQLLFSTVFLPKTVYNLSVSTNIEDCPGNSIAANTSVRIGIAEPAEAGNVLINEILFNPATDVTDFVELYNNSDKIIDLSELKIANVNLSKGAIESVFNVNTEGRILFPGEYVAVSENPASVINYYSTPAPENVILIFDLPSYNDDKGGAVLMNKLNTRIDSMYYSEKWHYPLLTDVEAVSLERMSFIRPSVDSTNWHSAAQTVHYATPGYRNSQTTEIENPLPEISILPETFSPDDDGYNDVVTIAYSFDEPGLTCNMDIYNSRGQLVRHILRNTLISNSGFASWDGINEANEKSPIGIYVVYTEVFNQSGDVKKYKNALVLAGILSK